MAIGKVEPPHRLPPNAGKFLASTDAETLLESIHTDTVVMLVGWLSGFEYRVLFQGTWGQSSPPTAMGTPV